MFDKSGRKTIRQRLSNHRHSFRVALSFGGLLLFAPVGDDDNGAWLGAEGDA